MVYIILYLVGGLLFVNGLFLLGYVTNLAGVVAFNFIGGTLITIMGLYIAAKDLYGSFGDTVSCVVASACLTFSIAYLMIALEGYTAIRAFEVKADFTALGWYCLPMSICLFFIFLGWFQVIGKQLPKVPQFGILWLVWASCFFLFFLILGAKASALWWKITGWWIIIVGFVTCSYPALANFQAGKVGKW